MQNSDPESARGQSGKLVALVESKLREAIRSGRYEIGDRLPTEVELTRELGVSRTVLREAVAVLRSDGILEARQGAGVYVQRSEAKARSLNALLEDNPTVSGVIEELELRGAVEIEAASLAAERASPAQLAKIISKLNELSQSVERGENTEVSDFEFHMAIAEATNNSRFVEFLNHLGQRTIPRVKLRKVVLDSSVISDEGLLQAEHKEIAHAILEKNSDRAKAAMKVHLVGGMERYKSRVGLI